MNIKKDSIKYFFELVVVFLGVTSAFMLTQWSENRRARKAERKYLENIYKELEEDDKDLKRNIELTKKKIKNLEALIKLLNEEADVEIIESLIPELFEIVLFKSKSNTWITLKESGELKLIRNFQLKIKLENLHIFYWVLDEISEWVSSYFKTHLLSYFLENIDLNTSKFIHKPDIL